MTAADLIETLLSQDPTATVYVRVADGEPEPARNLTAIKDGKVLVIGTTE